MRTFTVFATVCVALMIASCFAAVVCAEGKGDQKAVNEKNGNADGLKEKNGPRRDLEISQEKNTVTVSSSTKDEKQHLWFDFTVKADDSLTVKATYAGLNKGEGDKTGLLLDFSGLVEFLDANGNGAYDPKTDKVYSTYPLSGSFYKGDFGGGKNDYKDNQIDPKSKDYVNDYSESAYMKGFGTGFDKGFDRGYDIGVADKAANTTFAPEMKQHYNESEMKELLTAPKTDEKSADWFQYGFFSGMLKGFNLGYGKGYGPVAKDTEEPVEKEGEPLGTRTEEEPVDKEATDGEQGTNGNGTEDTKNYEDYKKYVDEGVVPPVEFKSPLFQKIQVDKNVVDKDHQTIRITVSDIKGIFTIVCTITNDYTLIDNGYLSPYSVKIDVIINGYQYTQDKTQLALLTDCGITTKQKEDLKTEKRNASYDEEQGISKDEQELRMTVGNFSGFFSWIKYAKCDGVNQTVSVTDVSSFYGQEWTDKGERTENFKGIIISYPRAKKIVHDPKLGFITVQNINVYGLSSTTDVTSKVLRGNLVLYAAAAIMAIAFVAVSRKVYLTRK